MGNLLEVLDKISREVPEETIKKMINLDDFYKLCVDYGYSSTQDIFETEYKDILEKSINALTKSELSDNELDSVSGGSSSRFKSGVALVLASIGTLSPSIGAASQNSSSVLSNQSSISEKISGYAKSGKNYISSGLNYLRNGSEYLLDKGKESLNKGLNYASKYKDKFVEYGSDAVKRAGDFVKAHPVGSSAVGVSGVGVVGTGAILINKLSYNNENSNLISQSPNLTSPKVNQTGTKNSKDMLEVAKKYFPNIVRFINFILPKSNNNINTCEFVTLKPHKQKELISMCLKDLGMSRKLVLDDVPAGGMIVRCIDSLVVGISETLKNKSKDKDKDKLDALEWLYSHLHKLGVDYKKSMEVKVKTTLNGKEYVFEGIRRGNDNVLINIGNGKTTLVTVDENMYISLDNETSTGVKAVKEFIETDQLKKQKEEELKAEAEKKAKKYIKENNKKVEEAEKKLAEIKENINNLDQEISQKVALSDNYINELNEINDKLEKAKTESPAMVKDYEKEITEKKKQIEGNKIAIGKLRDKRDGLALVLKKEENWFNGTIKKYNQHKATLNSIENGTYKVDKAKLDKALGEERLKKEPPKTSFSAANVTQMWKIVQEHKKFYGESTSDEEETDDEEWFD